MENSTTRNSTHSFKLILVERARIRIQVTFSARIRANYFIFVAFLLRFKTRFLCGHTQKWLDLTRSNAQHCMKKVLTESKTPRPVALLSSREISLIIMLNIYNISAAFYADTFSNCKRFQRCAFVFSCRHRNHP
jgi:hypothetical protein